MPDLYILATRLVPAAATACPVIPASTVITAIPPSRRFAVFPGHSAIRLTGTDKERQGTCPRPCIRGRRQRQPPAPGRRLGRHFHTMLRPVADPPKARTYDATKFRWSVPRPCSACPDRRVPAPARQAPSHRPSIPVSMQPTYSGSGFTCRRRNPPRRRRCRSSRSRKR